MGHSLGAGQVAVCCRRRSTCALGRSGGGSGPRRRRGLAAKDLLQAGAASMRTCDPHSPPHTYPLQKNNSCRQIKYRRTKPPQSTACQRVRRLMQPVASSRLRVGLQVPLNADLPPRRRCSPLSSACRRRLQAADEVGLPELLPSIRGMKKRALHSLHSLAIPYTPVRHGSTPPQTLVGFARIRLIRIKMSTSASTQHARVQPSPKSSSTSIK